MKIRKAIIPILNNDLEFLPVTKEVPKEMLTIIDKPVIQFVLDELIKSDVTEVLIVSNNSKSYLINEYFKRNYELENYLKDSNKYGALNVIKNVNRIPSFFKLDLSSESTLGDMIYKAKGFIGGDPFFLVIPDFVCLGNNTSLMQLNNEFEKKRSSVIATTDLKKENNSDYFRVFPFGPVINNAYEIHEFEEKGKVEIKDIALGSIGRFAFTNTIINILEEESYEIDLGLSFSKALRKLIDAEKVFGYNVECLKYYVGLEKGFVEMVIDYALNKDELKYDVKKMILEKVSQRN